MIQDAERSGDADDPHDGERDVQQVPGGPPTRVLKTCARMPLSSRIPAASRHADEEFHLVMKPAAIVQNSNRGDQRGAGENAFDLRARRAVEQKQDAKNHTGIHRQSAQQGNRLQMNFARTGKIHHANAQGQRAHRNGEQSEMQVER